MKKIARSVILSCIFLPTFAFAHGGVEKSAGNVTFFLNQSPISPLVGENVKMNFVLAERSNVSHALSGFKVKLSLIDTFYGDESKDKVILMKDEATDVNGAFDFEYSFSKQNYFDVELSFIDPVGGEKEVTGFLVQPRYIKEASSTAVSLPAEDPSKQNIWPIVFSGLAGLGIGLGIKLGSKTPRNKA